MLTRPQLREFMNVVSELSLFPGEGALESAFDKIYEKKPVLPLSVQLAIGEAESMGDEKGLRHILRAMNKEI